MAQTNFSNSSPTMAALEFPLDPNGNPLGAQVDKGCITCPTGSSFTSDVAISTLERVVNKLMLEGYQDLETPQFPLSGMPIKAADAEQMTGIKRYRYSVGYPSVHTYKMHDPTPSVQTFDVTRELIEKCGGNLATAQMVANANSLGCAPPFGERGISGKRVYDRSAVTGVINMGPFCVTDYLEQRDFASHLEAYKRAGIRAIGMMLEYEKIRRFVDMSRRNGSAIAGTLVADFQVGSFPHIPNSAGSFEWLIQSIEKGIGGEIMARQAIEVSVSPQLLKYWVETYARNKGIELKADWSNIKGEAQQYQLQWDGGTFELLSLQRGRRIRISTTWEPVYVEVESTGASAAEWDFQDYHLLELGNDPDTSQASGFFMTGNPDYGNPNKYCEGAQKRLCEMILIHPGDAFEYQAFPNNPLGTAITGVEGNLQNLWGATEMMLYTGIEVEKYFLDPINAGLAGTGAPCFNNRNRTWFAGEVRTGCQFVEKKPETMMSLLVQVPPMGSYIEKCEAILPCSAPPAIEVTPVATKDPALCTPIPGDPEPDPLPAGCFRPPAQLILNLPCEDGDAVDYDITFERVGGSSGSLAVPFTVTDGTAEEGPEFDLAAGTLTFADLATTATLTITLNPTAKPEGVNFLNATIVWDNDPEVICEGGWEETALCFRLCSEIAADDPQACPTEGCDSCA